MILTKIGKDHLDIGKNCQDASIEIDNIKIVCDGCGESQYSELGAQLFCHLYSKNKNIEETFNKIYELFNQENDIKNYTLFTTLILEETETAYKVNYCGDGYIILHKLDDTIEYINLDEGPAPEYYMYNFIGKEHLSLYKDGVEFKELIFKKEEYKSVGVASDGLRFILNSLYKEDFEELIKTKKLVKIKRFINKYQSIFRDDISIAI